MNKRSASNLTSSDPGTDNCSASDRVANDRGARNHGIDRQSGQGLLIVDDDTVFRERLGRAFMDRGYRVYRASNGEEALCLQKKEQPKLALVDLRMPGEWGLHTVSELLRVTPETRIVVLTAYGSIATALEAVRLGAVSYLQKPASVDEIERALVRAPSAEPLALSVNPDEDSPTEVPTLARAEWEHINRVLTECHGNIRKAAELLGLHRRTLQRKLAKFPSSR